ncbi:MAG: hypothetical protein GC179_11275 [Anaerolineaceae bacterium]|nr:hypothetical protein [Anaerolineaceae bacterium]
MADENTRSIYQQLCESYRAIDSFRTALLGFLPLASGTGILVLYNGGKAIENDAFQFLPSIGLFGFVATLGLFVFEIYGIRKCKELIETGKVLETQMGVIGQFLTRPDGVWDKFDEPTAAALIYPAVLAAWLFVFLYGLVKSFPLASVAALVLFVLVCRRTLHYRSTLNNQNGIVVERLKEARKDTSPIDSEVTD